MVSLIKAILAILIVAIVFYLLGFKHGYLACIYDLIFNESEGE